MSFLTDKQTLEDLNITGKFKPQSVFNLFNNTCTAGGETLLEKMFNHPLSDPADINSRTDIFYYFQFKKLPFPFEPALIREAESYLGADTAGSYLVVAAGIIRKRIMQLMVKDEQYEQVQRGVGATITLFKLLNKFLEQLQNQVPSGQFRSACKLFSTPAMKKLLEADGEFTNFQLARYDHLIRHVLRAEVEGLMELIYHIDVYIAVSDIAREKGFSYARAVPKEEYVFRADSLKHPALANATGNELYLNENRNVVFLTGANMAGKSTFMKSLGIAVYLAHMGFPVAAKDMVFSIRDGLFTSINVPDNLSLGYSHFYAEVLRVKQVAEKVAEGNDLVVIFDELFKGTNVKDAYDATLAVTKEFAQWRNSLFVISTHIIEVGEVLMNDCKNLQFSYLPTIMEGSIPKYTYKLTAGITNDRHGMMIIENEGILDMIED